MEVPRIIPLPYEWRLMPGSFELPQCVCIGHRGEGAQGIAKYLADALDEQFLSVEVQAQQDGCSADISMPEVSVMLSLEPQGVHSLEGLPHAEEAYELCISAAGIAVRATQPHGLFNGAISLLQLLPPCAPLSGNIRLDCLQVVDAPRFEWRGFMLDVGRHFFSVPFILRMLDVAAFYRLNRFHWHLTEDQGWRLEVKAYPRLTEFGSRRGKEEAHMHAGFYTQAQVREVVEYAAQRFITVVPEIELPGHCGAALACYPHLSCRGEVREVPTQWGVHEDVFCAGNEDTFAFLQGVLKEVLALFPSKYIHIGGDECPKARWHACKACQARLQDERLEDEYELQSWFVGRVSAFLREQGRQMIGWDEILEGGLPPGAIVMSWRGVAGGVKAAQAGHEVIMTPTSHCYLDYRQSLKYDEPGAWYAMLPLEVVYAFDPVPPPPPAHPCVPLQQAHALQHAGADEAAPLEEDAAAAEQASTSDRAEMEDTEACAPGAAGSRASVGLQEDDEAAFVGPPPPPMMLPPLRDQGANAESMESAEAPQPMSLSGPASPRQLGEGDEDEDIEEDRYEEAEEDSSRAHDALSARQNGLPGVGKAGSAATMDENGDAGAPGLAEHEGGGHPALMALPVRPQCLWTLKPEHAGNIRGGQANLWTEYVSDEATAEYMLLPRLAAMAEVLWSPLAARDWASFLHRLKAQLPHLDARGVNYRQLE